MRPVRGTGEGEGQPRVMSGCGHRSVTAARARGRAPVFTEMGARFWFKVQY